MENILLFINKYLGPIDIVIGIITIIYVILTYFEVRYGRARRHRIWHDEARNRPGIYPSILIVDLLTNSDITNSVERFRQRDDVLKTIPPERLFRINRTEWLKPEHIPGFVSELTNVAAEVVMAGTDTLHLFYAGPVIPTAYIGAKFSNTCRVILYQHTRDNDYVNWGPLRHEEQIT